MLQSRLCAVLFCTRGFSERRMPVNLCALVAGAREICVCVRSRGHRGREHGLERQVGRHARITAPRVCGRVRQVASKGRLEVGARLQLHLPRDAAPQRASGAVAAPAGPSR
jgi:hypothetical protein